MTIDYVTDEEFWDVDAPGQRIRGQFSAEAGQRPQVSLVAALIAYPREEELPGAIRKLGIPEAALAVAAFRPVTLHGELDTGEPVTVLHARNNGGRSCTQPPTPGRHREHHRSPDTVTASIMAPARAGPPTVSDR